MAKLTNDYVDYAIHKVIIDALQKDGVVCNSNTKEYDIDETYRGGTGFRLAFTKYNQTISEYHTALKVLLGIQKANIHESIPVIDFLHPSNTGFLYSYHLKEDGASLDPTTIYPAEENDESCLSLIEKEDPFTINRAIVGEDMAEHFYNAVNNPSDMNIQTSPWPGSSNIEYTYHGVKGNDIYSLGKYIKASTLKSTIFATRVFNEAVSTDTVTFPEYINIIYRMDNFDPACVNNANEDAKGVTRDSYGTLVLNSSRLDNEDYPDYAKNFQVDNKTFITKETRDTDNDTVTQYILSLEEQDICIAIPRTTYSDDGGLSRLLVYKYSPNASVATLGSKYWGSYVTIENGVEVTHDDNCITSLTDEELEIGDTYFLLPYPDEATNTTPIPAHLQYGADIQFKERSTTESPVAKEDQWEVKGNNYKCFIIPVSSYSSTKVLTEIQPEDQIPDYLSSTYVYESLKNYLDIEKIYTAPASGLLNGLYCEPYKRTSSELSSRVTSWKFVSDQEEASKRGVTLDIGAKYYKGHLLGRGLFDAAPLALTEHDTLPGGPAYGKNYKGKAEAVYYALTEATKTLFNRYQVDNFNNFSLHSIEDVVTKADYAGATYSVSEAKDLLGINTDSSGYKYSSILTYPEKLKQSSGKPASIDTILQYINTCLDSCTEDPKNPGTYILKLDLSDTSGPCVWTRVTHQKYSFNYNVPEVQTDGCGKVKGTTEVTKTGHDTMHSTEVHGETGEIYSKLDKNFAVTYNVDFAELSKEQLNDLASGALSASEVQKKVGDIYGINLKLITPLEAFSTKDTITEKTFYASVEDNYDANTTKTTEKRKVPNGTILVYPEYSKYYPETLLLLSRDDLSLEAYSSDDKAERSMVSFIGSDSNGARKVISFRVAEVKAFRPSKIKKVNITTPSDGGIEVSYKYGLYPQQQEVEYNYITGFETISVLKSSEKVRNSAGYEFRVDDIAAGKYVLNTIDSIAGYIQHNDESASTTKTSKAKVKAASLKLASLQAELGITEESPAPVDSTDFEISNNKLKVETGNEEALSKESFQKSLKNIQTPITGAWQQPDSNVMDVSIQRHHDYRSKTAQAMPEVESSIQLGGSSDDGTRSKVLRTYYADYEYYNGKVETVEYYDLRVPIIQKRYQYKMSEGTDYDCFIYVLKPMQLPISDLNVYDQNDQKINLGNSTDIDILPMSYPSSYFQITSTKAEDGSFIHRLSNRADIKSLKNSCIVPGLPKVNGDYEKALRTSSLWHTDLTALADMIYAKDSTVNTTLESILGNVMYQIFSNWKLSGLHSMSGATQNPLKFSELPALVKGLTELAPIIRNMVSSEDGFNIATSSGTLALTSESFSKLLKRIEYSSKIYKNDFNFGDPSTDSYVNTGDFEKDIKTALDTNWDLLKATSLSQTDRPSLKTLSDLVNKTLGPGSKITPELCKRLDSCFGNGTKPFLVMGSSEVAEFNVDGKSVQYGYNADITRAMNIFEEKITSLILKRSLAEKQAWINNKLNSYNLIDKIKAVYNKYYTSAAVTAKKSLFGLNTSSFNNTFTIDDIDVSRLLTDGALKDVFLQVKKLNLEKLWYFRWKKMSYEEWVKGLKLTSSTFSSSSIFKMFGIMDLNSQKRRVLQKALAMIREKTLEEVQGIINAIPNINKELPTSDQITTYLHTPNNANASNPSDILAKNNLWYSIYSLDPAGIDEETGQSYVHYRVYMVIPSYDPSTNTFAPSKEIPISKMEGKWKLDIESDSDILSHLIRKNFKVYSEEISDVSEAALSGLASYVKTCLEGTGSDAYYVKYTAGDNQIYGRKNSLYYRRYQLLNNRMNMSYGTLAMVFPMIRNKNITKTAQQYSNTVIDSYSDSLSLIPVAKLEPLAYMPAQEATATTIELPGKFYYAAELEALRAQISGRCILTCSKCTIQSSCPFYSEDEIIKMYCAPAETIDFYVKDNELDLIAYVDVTQKNDNNEDEIIHYPYLTCTEEDGQYETLDIQKLKDTHKIYNNILSKVETEKIENYEGKSIADVREELASNLPDSVKSAFNDEDVGLGFLLGGRYGTVQKNGLAALANEDADFDQFNGVKIPEYQYLYDALYIQDTETYVNYDNSKIPYDVSVTLGPHGAKKTYTGKTYVKVPTSLKILANADREDHVYLVSDDNVDSAGSRILPLIYLGRVKNLQYSFGVDESSTEGIKYATDTTLYAQDIAQWCINYYKGHCTEDPIADIGPDTHNPIKSVNEDRDQYWMPELKKYVRINDDQGEITEGWITVEGRPRVSTGYQEPVMDPDNFNDIDVVAGKPVALDYKNFLRRVSIRMYDPSKAQQYDEEGNLLDEEAWCIPWVRNLGDDGTKTLKNGLVISKETQKAALAYMKTNLRLVVVKD